MVHGRGLRTCILMQMIELGEMDQLRFSIRVDELGRSEGLRFNFPRQRVTSNTPTI